MRDQLISQGQGLCALLIGMSALKLGSELTAFRHLKALRNTHMRQAARLMLGDLRNITISRFMLGLFGGMLFPLIFVLVSRDPDGSAGPLIVVSTLAFVATLSGELLERYLFFRLVDAPKMPGGSPS